MLETAAIICTATLVFITLLPMFPSDHWVCRVWEFPRVQIGCLAIFSASLSLFLASPNLMIILLFSNLLVAAYQAWWILPFTMFYPKQVQSAKHDQQICSIKIMTSNVLMTNHSSEKLLNLVAQHKPDVLVTLETNLWWQEALESIHPDYPHRVNQPLENLYGMHLYSKYPLQDVVVKDLFEQDIPSIHCYLEINKDLKVKCHFLHPAPPSPTENECATPRDKELLLIAKEVQDKTEPIIVTGDLNDVAWSPTTRAFRRISGLKDPRIGRGMFNTFHAKYAFMRWPLDHIFHSEHFELGQLQRLPSIDSDHFPLLSHLVYREKVDKKR